MDKFLVGFLTFLAVVMLPSKSFALLPSNATVKQVLNTSATGGPSVLLGTQLTDNKVQVLKCTYSFATQGGAVSTINTKAVDGLNCTLPAGSIVKKVVAHTITAPTSGSSATLAFSALTSGDLVPQDGQGAYSLNGLKLGVPDSSAIFRLTSTASKVVTATIGAAALTAGKIELFIEYYIGI